MIRVVLSGLTIGNVASQCGVKLETVRYYERQGLLPKPPRTPSGYRVFPNDSVLRIRFIKHAQSLGFTLKEIRELLALRIEPATSCSEVRQHAEAKIRDIEQRMASLARMRETLKRLAAQCGHDHAATDCPILEALAGNGRQMSGAKRRLKS